MRRRLAAFAITLALGTAGAQQLERACLPGNDLANGLELRVDATGVMHLTRVARVSGDLLYTRIGADGVAVDERIEARISRLAVDEVTDTGLLVDADDTLVCYYSATDKRFKIATRQGDGTWALEVLATGDGVGRTCDLVRYKGDPVVAWYEAGTLRVATRGGGVWRAVVADAPVGADVGHAPSIATGPDNAIAIAHFDAMNEVLRISSLDGVWESESVDAAGIGTGFRPAAYFSAAGELFVHHGGVPTTPDVTSDVILFQTRGVPGAGFLSGQLEGVNVGGSLDGVESGGLATIFVRQRQRSALFGDADALRMHRGPVGAALEVTVLEDSAGNERRHAYQFLQAAHDPFHLPVLAFLDDAPAFFNQPASALLCYYRPTDADSDALPDEIEDVLGTRPDDPDTDGDGRTDGEEVLIDGTDPAGGPDCIAEAETCDGVDEDCDGVADENLARVCYPADPRTRDVGPCRAGAESCVGGEFGACQGAVTPSEETCDLRDEDCDAAIDEGNPGGGAPCDTGLLGVCGDGAVTCVAGRLECAQQIEAGDEACNLEDDDCDGEIDEGRVECGLGVCHRELSMCEEGEVNVCVPFESQGPDDQCDDLDDDCDGATDEHFPVEQTSCGVGACAGAGESQCVVGQLVDTCIEGAAQPDDPTCDAIDDDCDGETDEDFPVGVIHCGIGACRRQGVGQCVDGAQIGDCTPGEPGVEGGACDGLDQDCDGRSDEDFAPDGAPCGVGACATVGATTCVDGQLGDDCEPLLPSPNDAACDGVDDDCDGAPDEDYAPRPVSCGEGVCVADGETECVGGVEADVCTPGAPAGNDDTCDGSDDDCDGTNDEDYVALAVECGIGACAAQGETRCEAGEVVDDCVGGEGAGADGDCDGIDDDCDGTADEGYEAPATACGAGACVAQGELRCVGAELVDTCVEGAAAVDDDTCDGVDDDCDGAADEDFVSTESRCGTGACAAEGVTRCEGGAVVDTCAPREPAVGDRSCDTRDDDCDGAVDEDFRSRRTFCGIGACAALGETRCEVGEVIDSCEPRDQPAPDDATCDGVDDDCDGRADEDYVAPATDCGVGACARQGLEICERGQIRDTCEAARAAEDDRGCDGVDADCDGEADEDFRARRTFCGIGACAAAGDTFCDDGVPGDTCTPGDPAPNDASCDAVDDDCDGLADEAYPVSGTECGVGACARDGFLVCRRGAEIDTCEAGGAGPDDRVCDGVDADCDGATDEDFAPQATSCGVGACAADGETFCAGGEAGDTCTPGLPAADDASCDGVDNDCDGLDDEDHVRAVTDCGAGACRAQGERVCVLGEERDTCVPLDGQAAEDATCDGRDDDCDGQQDEDYVETPTVCGEGGCGDTGAIVCDDGAPRDTCRPRRPTLQDATCDGIDDDCDDAIDEDYQSRGVDCGAGVCVSSGVSACDDGVESDDCVPGPAQGDDDDCDVIDQDCDGAADEDFPVAQTACGVGDCEAVGQRRCEDGQVRDTCEIGAAALTDSTCDARDDDCDGETDEDFQVGPTECGVGACGADGDRTCEAGETLDSCVPGEPAADDATCDRADDDCDGRVDEAFPVRGTECGVGACGARGESVCEIGQPRDTCVPGVPGLLDQSCDGADDDCDGFIDEDFQPRNVVCGVGACFREGDVTCVAGAERNDCEPGEPAEADASCDLSDDDCDGTTDEDYEVVATVCGEGVCQAAGELRCVNGAESDTCVAGAPTGPDEGCDGRDDDCDGATDEGYVVQIQRCGVGACRAAGALRCEEGVEVDTCVPGEPAADDASCDGVDDDCDEVRDEDYVEAEVGCGTGVCAAVGRRLCLGGVETEDCDPQPPAETDATCDGADDDCDGATDEDFAGEIACGVGGCEVIGSQRCVEGERVDDCVPGAPTADDTCDGMDDDCDGIVDEAYEPQGVSCGVGACVSVGVGQCAEGEIVSDCVPGQPAEDDESCDEVDDDCDGIIDEDCPVDAGVDPDDGVSPDMRLDPDDGVPPDMRLDPDDGVPPDMRSDEGRDSGDAAMPDGRTETDGPVTDAGPDARIRDGAPDAVRDACVGAECPERPRVRKAVPDDPLNCSCDAGPGGAAPWLLMLLLLYRPRRSTPLGPKRRGSVHQ